MTTVLLNDFYFIDELHTENDQVSIKIRINPAHKIFEGHFPGQPVVPGVCMVQIVKELMEQHLNARLLLHKGNQLKFLQLTVPDENDVIEVSIQFRSEGNAFVTQAAFKKENNFVFKLQGEFRHKT